MEEFKLSKEITDAGIRLARPVTRPVMAIQGKDVDLRKITVAKARSIAQLEGSVLEFVEKETTKPAPAKEAAPKSQKSDSDGKK